MLQLSGAVEVGGNRHASRTCHRRLEVPGISTVKVAFMVVPLSAPEIVTVASVFTVVVLMTNVAPVAPPGTVTLAGTLVDGLLLDNDTTDPPAGAAPPSVTVPVEEFPPIIVAGFSVTDTSGTPAAAVLNATTTEDSGTDAVAVPVAV